MHDVPVQVRQPEIPARVAVGQLRVIEAEEVEDRGVEVVDVDGVLFGSEPELVRRSVDCPAFYASAGQPIRKPVVVVVAPVSLARVRARRQVRQWVYGRTRRPR